jgi:hypothetical protein
MARNTPRSQNGRSAVARKAIFSATGKTNSFYTNTKNGGGMKKGGAQPSATGFMIPFAQRNLIAVPALNANYLFNWTPYINPGRRAYGANLG